MKTIILTTIILIGATPFSPYALAEASKEEWQSTVLTESTIKKVQEAKIEYKKCIGEQLQKSTYLDMDSRKATDEIIKHCETSLSKMRGIYLDEKVPGEIADRHLRQLRIQMSRNALESLIFAQAARTAGQP